MSKWVKLTDALPEDIPGKPGEAKNSVLLYHPGLDSDEDFPGHAFTVSNRQYILVGNAVKGGYTHWCPIMEIVNDSE